MLGAVDVMLPDGTLIRASSIFERNEHDPERSFGLYMDERWSPTWPSDMIAWVDFGLPTYSEEQHCRSGPPSCVPKGGECVEIGCLGGRGRTGTVLACMAVLAGVEPGDAVPWVRRTYQPGAVETADQEAWVLWFAEWAVRSEHESDLARPIGKR